MNKTTTETKNADTTVDTDGSDQLDPKTESKAQRGIAATRRERLASADVPLSTLAHLGIEIPHRDFEPEDAYEYPTTVVFDDDSRVHLHQDVREDMDEEFGSFGVVEDDEDEVIWTVVDLTDETVTITVVGDWGKRRDVPFEEFPEDYEPITYETNVGTAPRFGY